MADKAQVDAVGAMFMGEEPEVAQEEVQEEVSEEVVAEEPEVEGDDSEEETDQSEEETEESPEDLVEVEWDGQLIEAPRAVAEALMRNADYTQKTQEVAQQRQQAEVLHAELEQQRQQYEFAQSIQSQVQEIQVADQTVQQLNQYLRDNIESLSSTDIEKIRFQIQDTQNQRQEIVGSLEQKQQEFQQAQEQSQQELLKKGTEILRQRIPGWGEESVKQVREFALSSGFTDAELNSVIDPRHIETLWKASQYDSLQSGKQAAVKKVQEAPKVSSRNPMPKETRNKLDLRNKLKSNKLSARDKQNLVAQDLANRWA